MAEIRCGNCGELHGSIAEVKTCHQERPSAQAPGSVAVANSVANLGSESAPARGASQAARSPANRSSTRQTHRPSGAPQPGAQRSGARQSPATRVEAGFDVTPAAIAGIGAVLGPGPDSLGRTLVIPPGTKIPEAWKKCDIFEVDAEILQDPELTADELSELWFRRERYIVELSIELPSGETDESPVWELEPGFTFHKDRLLHFVFSNAVRLVRSGDKDSEEVELASALADRAAALGAKIGGSADVVLPDGTEAWLDGGPMDPLVTPEPVVHAVSLDAGVLRPLGKAEPDADLAPDQLAAVAHRSGAARIIAPAGSGKTRVLTERARHLVHNWAIPTSALTLVAFNKRAQIEMSERTQDLRGLRVRTLNSLALQIINDHHPVSTVSERDIRRLISNLVQFPRKANADPVASWFEALTAVRLGLRDPDEVEASFHGDVDSFAEVFDQFRDKLARSNTVDFDEQIYLAIEILLRDPRARRKAQLGCSVLLVDEFQDLTPAHLLLIRLLAGPRADVFGVGDDDQTIYGFTGANPRWLIDYDQFFPGSQPHALEVNYRCAPGVVSAAANLLEYNTERVVKTITSAPNRKASNGDLTLVKATDGLAELVKRIRDLIEGGTKPADIVVLSRVNVTLAVPQVALAHSGLPVTGAVGPALLDRTGVRAALAWMRVATSGKRLTPHDISESGRRPSRGLSPRVLEWMGENNDLAGITQLAGRLKDKDAAKIKDWMADVRRLRQMVTDDATSADLLVEIQDSVGLATAMGTLDASRGNADRSTHIDDLTALVSLAALEPDPMSFVPWLRDALDQPRPNEGEAVFLSTVHRVKGQEWPHVFVYGVDQGTFPHRLAERPEERRVFHVAITRSSTQTTVIADPGRPSQFLTELTGERSKTAKERTTEQPKDWSKQPGKKPAKGAKGAKTGRGAKAGKIEINLSAEEHVRFDALKKWRLEASRKAKVPAFIVFGDGVLATLAKDNPINLTQLSLVKGVGPAKLENYGDEVLAVLTGG